MAVFPGANGQILFVSGRGGDPGDGDAGIFLIDSPSDTTPTGPIDLIAGQHRHPNWAPDGKTIIAALRGSVAAGDCAGADTTDDDLILRDALGGTTFYFPSPTPCLLDDHPTFSPDQASIAWESEITDGPFPAVGKKDILIGPGDGTGAVTNLTNTANDNEETPVWSPDGDFIYYAFTPNMASTADIVREPAGGGAFDVIEDAATVDNEFQPEISPDGTKLCYTRGPFGSADADVMVANVDSSGTPIELNPADSGGGAVADYDCGWSPDGTTVAFTRGAFGAGELQFADATGAGDPVPYGLNSVNFDGNVDWARDPHQCDQKYVTIVGTAADDDIEGTPGNDVVAGLGGKDTIHGKSGNDRLCGGAANDTLKGGAGRDRLFGGVGKDNLQGGVKRDQCTGGPGQDKAKSCEKKTSI
jgi:Ca2+-binding RTX toxin-like protein